MPITTASRAIWAETGAVSSSTAAAMAATRAKVRMGALYSTAEARAMWCGCSEGWMRAAPLDRRQALMTLAAPGCATIKPEHNEAALRLTEESTSVDLHSHPGMLPASPLSTEGQLQRMSTGKVRASLFAAVADGPLIGRRPTGGLHASREPRPGELYASTYRSLDRIRAQ